MRFDLEPFRQFLAMLASYSPPSLLAAGGAALAALTVMYGALLGTGENAAEADTVAVTGSVFRPVAVTPPAPTLAAHRSGAESPRFDDEISLTRAVQAELKRAGCYAGPINGVWSASTRAAMGEFAGRVNARLPVDRADPVLLALLETHNKISCTADCTTGGEPSCVARAAEPPAERSQVAGVERKRPAKAEAREERPPPAYAETHAYAEPEGLSAEDRRRLAPMRTASADADSTSTAETSALPAAVAPAPKVMKTERRRTSRRYKRQPSIARQVSRGLRSLQRDLNKLF